MSRFGELFESGKIGIKQPEIHNNQENSRKFASNRVIFHFFLTIVREQSMSDRYPTSRDDQLHTVKTWNTVFIIGGDIAIDTDNRKSCPYFL
jgi:hypothetical protein